MKKLIIGKNSNIIKSISNKIHDCDIISHKELKYQDLSIYSEIWIFSWSFTSFNENMELLKKIPLQKSIFISSTAVLSLNSREQWNNYPKSKLAAEKFVISKFGKVLRLGIIDKYTIQNSNGFIPVTKKEMIVDAINGKIPLTERVTTLAEIHEIKNNSLRFFMAEKIYKCSLYFPSKFLFQVPFEIINKYLLKTPIYGYTKDSCRCFEKTLVVGHGALGSKACHFLKKNKISYSNIVSNKEDILLTTNGFKGTRVGYGLIGLSKYWHGVYIKKNNNNFIKKVPLWIKRKKPSIYSFKKHISSISFDGEKISLKTENENLDFLCEKLILAAGPIENARILQSIVPTEFKFSDHEIGHIGTIDLMDPLRINYIKKFLLFIYGRKIFLSKGNIKFMLDLRPHNSKKHNDADSNIYNNSTYGIIKKLITRFSFEEINEAFFNKFGFSICTNRLSVFVQILSVDSVILHKDGKLSRKRITENEINAVVDHISKYFKTFTPDLNINLSDGQHILGGKEIYSFPKIKELIKSNKIIILGSPSNLELDAVHHTEYLRNSIEEKIRNSIET